jgi:hypothetical protein
VNRKRPFIRRARHQIGGEEKKVGVAKISKSLKCTIGATAAKAHMLGVSLDSRG